MTAPFSVSPAKPQILKKVCGFSFCPKAERRRRPMYFTSGSDRAFEQLMQGKPGFDHYDSGEAVTPEDCGICRFYRPHWKYQFCVYAECPYQPGKLITYDAVTFRVSRGIHREIKSSRSDGLGRSHEQHPKSGRRNHSF